MSLELPQGFLLGVATAAHQVEGHNKSSDYWLYEHIPGSEFTEPSGAAIDHYTHFPEDITLFAQLGFNCFRFSIEWARVEPEEGNFSASALEHYRDVLEACRQAGMEPIVTLHHFTSPLWLIANGGWEWAQAPERFTRYCEYVIRSLGDQMRLVCTMNEANSGALNVVTGLFGNLNDRHHAPWVAKAAGILKIDPSEFVPWNFAGTPRSIETILRAHKQAALAIKTARPELKVGLTLAMSDIQSVAGGEERASQVRSEVEDLFLAACAGDDFMGVQAYTRIRIGPEGTLPPEEGVELTQMGYEFWPQSVEAAIRHAADYSGLPIIVTENGIATEDDAARIRYIDRALQGVVRCLEDGIDVRGYVYWSAYDNYEWEFGYGPKFGLASVDRATQRRVPKPSAYWLGAIARSVGPAQAAFPTA